MIGSVGPPLFDPDAGQPPREGGKGGSKQMRECSPVLPFFHPEEHAVQHFEVAR